MKDEDSDDHCSIISVYKRSLGGTLLPLFESRRRRVTFNGSPNRKRMVRARDMLIRSIARRSVRMASALSVVVGTTR